MGFAIVWIAWFWSLYESVDLPVYMDLYGRMLLLCIWDVHVDKSTSRIVNRINHNIQLQI